MPDLELSITICSWNTRDDLALCLKSLEEAKSEANFEVIVVENNSEDDSAQMVETDFPWVKLLKQSQNLGFTRGHNLALGHAMGNVLALLNSDTIVHKGAISEVLRFMKATPDAGIVGPKLLNTDGSLQMSCRRFPKPMAAAFRNTFLGRIFPNNRYTAEYLMEDSDHQSTRTVDWVSGAAMFISTRLYNEIGGLDDDFFMFSEDVDYCRRCWNAGFKVYYLPSAEITHAIGRSTDKAPNRMISQFHQSMYRYYVKHDVPELKPIARPFAKGFAIAALTARASLFLIKNRFDILKRKLAKR